MNNKIIQLTALAIVLFSCFFYYLFCTLKGGEDMVAVYVCLIVYKRRTIDQVPKHLQKAVLADLNAMGLDGYGEPLANQGE